MGDILAFPRERRKALAVDPSAAKGGATPETPRETCEILFFTGIRYVRHEGPVKKRKSARRSDGKTRGKRERA